MAPLLRTLYRPSQRSLLSSLFTATFLGAVIVVAFPCPARPINDYGRAAARMESLREGQGSDGGRNEDWEKGNGGKGEVVVLMNRRGRKFLEER